MVTAAHCLYIADKLLSAQSLLVLLGLHDRSKKSEPNRYKKVNFLPHLRFLRKQIPVDEIFVHENFTTSGDKANDIALLRLGEHFHKDLADFPAVFF